MKSALIIAFILLATHGGRAVETRVSEETRNAPADGRGADSTTPYVPDGENVSAREWFQDAKFGVFIHWGVYSVPGRGEWAMNNEKISKQEYEKLPPQFNPTRFDAAEWVSLSKRAGAKYITFTAKHSDGFAMWDSKFTDWDIVDRTPYRRDVLKQLADECRRQGVKLFVYYSQVDWHHPDYYPRGTTGHHSGRPDRGDWNKYLAYMDAQLAELLSGEYGAVAGIWLDGWWDQQTKRFAGREDADPLATNVDWQLRRTYDMIHAQQPGCLIGNNHHVAPFQGEDFQMFERDLPGENKGGHSPDSEIGRLPLETCDSINDNWGYNAVDKNFKPVRQLVHRLVQAAGRNANFLLNVGPRPDGTIDPAMVRRLEGVGQWLEQYGPTIRGTRGGSTGTQPWGTSTQTADVIYLHVLDSSSAKSDGWVSLSGTESISADDVRVALRDLPVASRRDAQKRLEVRIDMKPQPIDFVLKLVNEDKTSAGKGSR